MKRGSFDPNKVFFYALLGCTGFLLFMAILNSTTDKNHYRFYCISGVSYVSLFEKTMTVQVDKSGKPVECK